MEIEIGELQEEIDLLKERINILEKKERNRKTYAYIKIAFRIILLFASIYGVLKGYQYIVNELPQIIENKVKELNPIKIKNN